MDELLTVSEMADKGCWLVPFYHRIESLAMNQVENPGERPDFMDSNSGKRRFPAQMRHTDFFLQLAHLERFPGTKIEFNRTPVTMSIELRYLG